METKSENKTRDKDQIIKECQELFFYSGQLQYELAQKNKALTDLNEKIKELNIESFNLQKKEAVEKVTNA